jgi:hypothetical protein
VPYPKSQAPHTQLLNEDVQGIVSEAQDIDLQVAQDTDLLIRNRLVTGKASPS